MNRSPFRTDERPVAFGRYIKAIREQKGIDLETVSDALKVSHHQLSLIEAEVHDELPDEIYVKGILRAYADYIGIDPDDLIDRYRINRAAQPKGHPAAGRRRQKFAGAWLRWLLLSVSLFFILAALVAGYSGWMAWLVPEPAVETPIQPKQEAVRPPAAAEEPSKKLVLVIDAVEKTWVKINIDGEEPLEYLLRPRDHVELEADSHYSMLIGNAAGLEMKLNGTPVPVPGKSGDVVSLELPGLQKTGRQKQDAQRTQQNTD